MTRSLALRPLLPAGLAATALLLAGCSPAAEGADTATGSGTVEVLASFYPLQYLAQEIGGDLVTVSSLTPPGAEPHDLELSPSQVREVGRADLVVYLSGFQSAVDDALVATEPAQVVDVAEVPAIAEHMGEEEDAEDEDHAEDEAEDEHSHDGDDPHFWLDPTLLAAAAPVVAEALAAADPDHAEDFAAGADQLVVSLEALDEEFTTVLATCERRVLVTSHAAFGYLAERYDLMQVGLSDLDPEAEPSPARLREIREVVEEHGVTTIFTEALVSPKVAETLADDLGISTAVLDPVESQVDEAVDYRGAMESNLTALRAALGCS
ncbi:metal ABC transporter substrate-binding protein [Actinotalea sp.]|uniref:metal ABC transporter substrate-binding protein n=1 Tax=Actinotalea sp. TaxID=1872145 RepID=UPI00356A69BA